MEQTLKPTKVVDFLPESVKQRLAQESNVVALVEHPRYEPKKVVTPVEEPIEERTRDSLRSKDNEDREPDWFYFMQDYFWVGVILFTGTTFALIIGNCVS